MIFPGPITCHDLKNLEDGWSLLNVFETPEFQAYISKSLTTQTFHLIALPASLPQNVSHTKSIMLPTKCLFSRWSCFCSWSHHSPSPGSEPQSSLNVPSLDSHREIHRFSQLYFCSSNTLITVRSLLTSWCLDPPLKPNIFLLCSSCGFFPQWLWEIETISFLSSKRLHAFYCLLKGSAPNSSVCVCVLSGDGEQWAR